MWLDLGGVALQLLFLWIVVESMYVSFHIAIRDHVFGPILYFLTRNVVFAQKAAMESMAGGLQEKGTGAPSADKMGWGIEQMRDIRSEESEIAQGQIQAERRDQEQRGKQPVNPHFKKGKKK